MPKKYGLCREFAWERNSDIQVSNNSDIQSVLQTGFINVENLRENVTWTSKLLIKVKKQSILQPG